MKLYIGADQYGTLYLEPIEVFLKSKSIEYTLVKTGEDVFKVTDAVCKKVLEAPQENRGIILDRYAVESFMYGSKFKHIICSQTNDEHSAMMTRDHNNANLITVGTGIVGLDVCLSIVERFVQGEYAGGRHQIRIDMLESMGS